jgi:pimeloyl-ACP methyl ester carboxylesterase
MGYNSGGWYGAQGPGRGFGGPGRGFGSPAGGFARATPPGTVLSGRTQEELKLTTEQKKKIEELQKEVDARVQEVLTEEQKKQLKTLRDNAGRGFGGFGGGQDAPENLGELSEKDVMNVLGEVRKAFSVDEKRIYLVGHSMGGAGAYYLGAKYPELWAGLAPIAAASGQPRNVEKLKKVPVIVVHGDNDTAVPVASARRWAERLKEQEVEHEYVELAGAGHGDVIGKGMPKIFEFFEKHKKAGETK